DRIRVTVDLLLVLDAVAAVDHAELETAGARVHGEDAHGSVRLGGSHPVRAHPGHRQSRISGMSSKCSRTYSWCRRSCASQYRMRSAAPAGDLRERWSASITRW